LKNLTDELKQKIVQTLNLEDIEPEEIGETDLLVGGELGLDSIDLLELVMMIEKDYGVKIDSEDTAKKVFVNLEILAGYISKHSTGAGR